jgi:N-acetylmuramoyl-L-alanine amidase
MPKGKKHCAGRTGRWACWLLAFLFSALCLLPPALAARPAPAKAVSKENPADAPVRRFQTLLTRKNTSKEALRQIEGELEQARSARPDGPTGAKATFFLARVQQEIAKKSGLKADWFKAAESFGQCAERFPKYQLAPDALLHRGLIRLERLSDPEGASADFKTLQRSYPRSPLAAKAGALARRAAKAPQPAAGRKPEPAPAPAASSPAPAADKPELLEVRPKNTGQDRKSVV